MVLSEDGEETQQRVRERFDELCLDLNMDRATMEETWEAFERISTNYTLEVYRLSCLTRVRFACPAGLSVRVSDRLFCFHSNAVIVIIIYITC